MTGSTPGALAREGYFRVRKASFSNPVQRQISGLARGMPPTT